MSFWAKLKNALFTFMQGRHGADQLGMFTLIVGLILSLLASFTGIGLLSLLGLALYVWTLFRMFSRNHEARLKENQKYVALTSGASTKVRQFIKRQQNRKEYKYFRCPKCRVLLRLRRGCGEKEITCVRCGHQFKQKA